WRRPCSGWACSRPAPSPCGTAAPSASRRSGRSRSIRPHAGWPTPRPTPTSLRPPSSRSFRSSPGAEVATEAEPDAIPAEPDTLATHPGRALHTAGPCPGVSYRRDIPMEHSRTTTPLLREPEVRQVARPALWRAATTPDAVLLDEMVLGEHGR